MLLPMRKRATTFILIVCMASAFAATARAQGKLSQSQTELSDTTISGYVQDGFLGSLQNTNGTGNRPLEGLFYHQRDGSTSLSPVPPTPPIEFFSTGADLMEAYRPTELVDQPVQPLDAASEVIGTGAVATQPILQFAPMYPNSPPLGTSAFDLQPVPEPSTFALGGLALGLIVVSGKRRGIKVFTFFG